MKIKFALGPYGYELVLGNISEEIYNKFFRNEKGIVLSEEEWNFNCKRLLEKAPKIDSKKVELSYNYKYYIGFRFVFKE